MRRKVVDTIIWGLSSQRACCPHCRNRSMHNAFCSKVRAPKCKPRLSAAQAKRFVRQHVDRGETRQDQRHRHCSAQPPKRQECNAAPGNGPTTNGPLPYATVEDVQAVLAAKCAGLRGACFHGPILPHHRGCRTFNTQVPYLHNSGFHDVGVYEQSTQNAATHN